jgi:hypothetical protein
MKGQRCDPEYGGEADKSRVEIAVIKPMLVYPVYTDKI